ncbi:amidohydrolase family protein [Sporolactobacillus sp. KGMB 08714]|uniref:amidohydrolase family protein n=1 Tax=Sporolactobacillus sp. KGMB 08714 TaxID=3064704 RepID=UPI002FBDFF9C
MSINEWKQGVKMVKGLGKAKRNMKIDVHVHYLPPSYVEALRENEGERPDGFKTPDWDPRQHIALMERLGIEISILSLSSPHVYFGDEAAAKTLARRVNEYGAELAGQYPGKFRLLASLPLPNVKDSIEEIRFALDELDADGFTLPTNTRGIYLGRTDLDPVFEVLNERKTVVVLHPNKPGRVPENVNEGLPIPAMEFLFDTTRTVINMIINGTFSRYKNIKFVIPHAGAFLSLLADRLDPFFKIIPVGERKVKADVYAVLKRLYYDVAGFCVPRQLGTLLQLVDASHLLYGSDYPYTPAIGCASLAGMLNDTDLLTEKQRQAMFYENALALFPRLGDVKK